MATVSPSVSQSTKYETAYAGRVSGGIYPSGSAFGVGNLTEVAVTATSTSALSAGAGLAALASGNCVISATPGSSTQSYTLPTASDLWTQLATTAPHYQQVGVRIPVIVNQLAAYIIAFIPVSADTSATIKCGNSTVIGVSQHYIVFTSPTAYTFW